MTFSIIKGPDLDTLGRDKEGEGNLKSKIRALQGEGERRHSSCFDTKTDNV